MTNTPFDWIDAVAVGIGLALLFGGLFVAGLARLGRLMDDDGRDDDPETGA